MKPRKIPPPLGNPFVAWSAFAQKTSEMMLASASVIGHRTRRMAQAGPLPNQRDRREFALMGKEKVEAAVDSAHAIAMHMMSMNRHLGAQAFKQMMAGATAMLSVASSRTVQQSITNQAKLMQLMNESAMTMSTLSGSAARLAHTGLKPIHSRATANARRLGKL